MVDQGRRLGALVGPDRLGRFVGDVADRLARLGPGIGGNQLGQLGQQGGSLGSPPDRRVKLGLPPDKPIPARREELVTTFRLLGPGLRHVLLEPAEELPGALECLRGCPLRGLPLLGFAFRHGLVSLVDEQ
jgi:hypothetical protein